MSADRQLDRRQALREAVALFRAPERGGDWQRPPGPFEASTRDRTDELSRRLDRLERNSERQGDQTTWLLRLVAAAVVIDVLAPILGTR